MDWRVDKTNIIDRTEDNVVAPLRPLDRREQGLWRASVQVLGP